MNKLILAGGSGYLGTVLANYFGRRTEIVVLSRQPLASFHSNHIVRVVHWDGKTLGSWVSELNGADAIINLAGRSVNCRYTLQNQQEIFESRTDATAVIAEAIQLAKHPPKVWINSSTATIYRHAEDRNMDEYTGEYQDDFSVRVAKQWESVFYNAAIQPIVRKIALRTAIVLGRTEGVMLRLMNLVKLGLGGKQGTGSQFVSWIHEVDFARAIEYLIERPDLVGTFNLAAPNPVTNDFLMRALRKAMQVPFGLPATKWMLRIGAWLIGTETELILKSRRVVPTRLLESGFIFTYPTILLAFNQIINKQKTSTVVKTVEAASII